MSEYNFQKDLEFALTRRQLRNHGVHVGVGLGISLVVTLTAGWWWGPLVAGTTALTKELGEWTKREVKGQPLHLVDGWLDVLGWVAGGLVVKVLL